MQRRDEPVAALAVLAASAAQMAIDLAARQQPGVGAGGDRGAAGVDRPPLMRDRLGQRGRGEQPAEPQRRRERLGRGAEIDDAVGREPLQRADRRAVVAVLGVIVVLDHDPAPRQQRPSPLGGEYGAGRELVRGRDEHRVGVQRTGVDAVLVDRHAHDLEPGRADRGPRVVERRILDRDPASAPRRQRPARQPQALRVAAGDDERGRSDAAHPHEVRGEFGAEFGIAVRLAVVERRVGHRRQHLPERRRPRAPGEGGEVRRGRGEVEPRGREGPSVAAGSRASAAGRRRARRRRPAPRARPAPPRGASRSSPRRRSARTPRSPPRATRRAPRRARATRAAACPRVRRRR